MKHNVLRPGITNPNLWFPERPSKNEWNKIRKVVLDRDQHTCFYCGHRALKFMNVHHVEETAENEPENLVTVCAACHAVLHMGRNLSLGAIEIWQSEMSQVEIIQYTRKGVASGCSLQEIKGGLPIKEGEFSPNSIEWANSLLANIGDKPRMSLPESLSAVFVSFVRWQIE